MVGDTEVDDRGAATGLGPGAGGGPDHDRVARVPVPGAGTDIAEPQLVASLAAWRKRGVQLSSLPMANVPPLSLTRIRTVVSNGATMGAQVCPPSRVMVTVEPPLAQSPTTNRQAVSASTATIPTPSGRATGTTTTASAGAYRP